jgi:hypothetical protein
MKPSLGYILGEEPPSNAVTAKLRDMKHDVLVGGTMMGFEDMYALLSSLVSGEHPLYDLVMESKTDIFVLPEYHEDLVGRLLLRNEPSDIAVYVVEEDDDVKLWGYYHPTDN